MGEESRKKRIIIIIRNRVKTICSQTSFGEHNKKKTKTMQFVQSQPEITLENEILEEVDEFTYLGSTISKRNATEKDITNRLQKAKSSFHQLNKIWRSSNIGEKTIKVLTVLKSAKLGFV